MLLLVASTVRRSHFQLWHPRLLQLQVTVLAPGGQGYLVQSLSLSELLSLPMCKRDKSYCLAHLAGEEEARQGSQRGRKKRERERERSKPHTAAEC